MGMVHDRLVKDSDMSSFEGVMLSNLIRNLVFISFGVAPTIWDNFRLVVWNMNFIFPYIGNVRIPIDYIIFFRGVG